MIRLLIVLLFVMILVGVAGGSPFLVSDPNSSCSNASCSIEFTGFPTGFTPDPAELITLNDGSIRVDLVAWPDETSMDVTVRVCREWGSEIKCSSVVPFLHPGRTTPSIPQNIAVIP